MWRRKMKKLSLVLVMVMILSLAMPLTAGAAGTASLEGPGVVRAGDTITINFCVNGSNIEGAEGTLSYNSGQLTLVGSQQAVGSPWVVEFAGSRFVAYDNDMEKPINGKAVLMALTFKVNAGLAAGTNISVSFADVKVSDGTNETAVGTISYNATLAEPLSNDCELSTMTVGNATISPAFSAGTTSYRADVPFEVSKLNVSATAHDAKASISIDSPTLAVNGTTNVTVTVRAESGATKTYVIAVHRAQDPNFKASTEAALTSITVENFYLSPAFSEGRTNYIVYMPFEFSSLSVSAVNKDAKGSYRIEGNEGLKVGENIVKVIGIAEDGVTEKVYTITVMRGESLEGATDPETEPETEEPTEEPTEETEESAAETETEAPSESETEEEKNQGVENTGIGLPLTLVLSVGCLVIGALLGFLLGRKKSEEVK